MGTRTFSAGWHIQNIPSTSKSSTPARLPEPTNSTCSRGRRLTKTFVTLLDVMKPGREHETACRGWEHPGLYGEPGEFLRGLGKHVGSPAPHTPSQGGFFFWRDWVSTNTQHSPT